jgi:hypothetical protein
MFHYNQLLSIRGDHRRRWISEIQALLAVLRGMAVARGEIRVINLSTLIVFSSKSTPIRDRMAGVFALAHAHASIFRANAHPEPFPCAGEFPEWTSRVLWQDRPGS